MGRKRGCPSPQALGPSMRDLLRQCQQEASTNPSISSHNLASHPTTSKVGHNSIPGLVRKRAWRPKKYVPSYFTPSSDQGRSISLCCELPKVNIPLRSRPLHFTHAHTLHGLSLRSCASLFTRRSLTENWPQVPDFGGAQLGFPRPSVLPSFGRPAHRQTRTRTRGRRTLGPPRTPCRWRLLSLQMPAGAVSLFPRKRCDGEMDGGIAVAPHGWVGD